MRLERKHPLAIRWFHWVHFPVLFAMAWSGLLILWANDVYPTRIYQALYRPLHGGREDETPPLWLKVPDRVILYPVGAKAVYAGADDPPGLPPARYAIVTGYRLAEGMAWHFALAWVFGLNGLAYALFLAASGEWRHLLPRRESLRGAVGIAVRDLAFWKRPELARRGEKYNHAQRLAYTGVVAIGGLMLLTGLAIYKPARLAWLAAALGGYQTARLEHFVLTCLFLLFFFVHVAQVVRAGWNNFRGMVTGHELVREEKP